MDSDNEDSPESLLSVEDRQRVHAQVDHFIDIISHRYGIKPADVVDTIIWVRERRSFASKVTMGGALSIMGIIASAMVLSMWEGIKHFLTVKP